MAEVAASPGRRPNSFPPAAGRCQGCFFRRWSLKRSSATATWRCVPLEIAQSSRRRSRGDPCQAAEPLACWRESNDSPETEKHHNTKSGRMGRVPFIPLIAGLCGDSLQRPRSDASEDGRGREGLCGLCTEFQRSVDSNGGLRISRAGCQGQRLQCAPDSMESRVRLHAPSLRIGFPVSESSLCDMTTVLWEEAQHSVSTSLCLSGACLRQRTRIFSATSSIRPP